MSLIVLYTLIMLGNIFSGIAVGVNVAGPIWNGLSGTLEPLAILGIIIGVCINFVMHLHEDAGRTSIGVLLIKEAAALLVGTTFIFILFGPIATAVGL